MWWMLLAATAQAAPDLAVHEGRWEGERMVWQSTISGRGTGPIPLAAPLPAGTSPRPPTEEDALVRDAEGQVVAIAWDVPLVLAVPEDPDDGRIAVPLIDAEVPQRVDVSGARFRPSAATGLEEHMGSWRAPGIERPMRRRLDRLADGRRARPGQQAIYLVVDDRIREAGGLEGTLRRTDEVPWGVRIVLGALVGLGALGGALLYRSLAHLARAERNKAYIERELGEP